MINKIAIFTGNLDFNVRWNVVTLAEEFPQTHFTILVHKPPKKIVRSLKNQVRNVRYHGWRWIPYQVREIIGQIFKKFNKRAPISQDAAGLAFTFESVMRNPQISIKVFSQINGVESCNFLRSLSVDLGIALSAPILKKELFSLPSMGTINLHKGQLPNYRGMPPAFWELKNKESTVGCTIHKVDSGLDSGDILLESFVEVDAFSTIKGLQEKLHHLGMNMVIDAVRLIAGGRAVFVKQKSSGHTNMRPPLALERRIDRERKKHSLEEPRARNILKNILFFTYVYMFKPFLNSWDGMQSNQKIIILLYHRVSDQFRDNVTIGIEQFDKQMAYLANNYVTVSLRDVVNGRVKRNSPKPLIAISFDDGYLDNFTNAAPILLKHQLPCTFFISTEKIAENKPFDHDLKALGFGLDNMNWNQVLKMKKWGLDFGSHTLNHVNLAQVNDIDALYEIEESMNQIRTRLNQNDVFIAYPYGGKRHINSERLTMIKNVGYSACFSAYGGCNTSDLDPFDIKRIGVNWAFGMLAFKARLRGWISAG